MPDTTDRDPEMTLFNGGRRRRGSLGSKRGSETGQFHLSNLCHL
jgi:hypothetical protein